MKSAFLLVLLALSLPVSAGKMIIRTATGLKEYDSAAIEGISFSDQASVPDAVQPHRVSESVFLRLPGSDIRFRLTGTPGTQYRYVVRALDGSGVEDGTGTFDRSGEAAIAVARPAARGVYAVCAVASGHAFCLTFLAVGPEETR